MMTNIDALKEVGAKDWHSLDNGQTISFFSDIAPKLSNEDRLRIFESAPEILDTVKHAISEYQNTVRETLEQNQEVVDKILEQNHDMTRAVLFSFHEALETFRQLLSDPNASKEDKIHWGNEMFNCLREMLKYDKEVKTFLTDFDQNNKSFLQDISKYQTVITIVVVGAAMAMLYGVAPKVWGKFKLPVK